jgi:hypothetical protein
MEVEWHLCGAKGFGFLAVPFPETQKTAIFSGFLVIFAGNSIKFLDMFHNSQINLQISINSLFATV